MEIQKLLSIQKYRLAFIGAPSSGKTTTICNYLNLIDDDLIGKPYANIELFNVGSGRTTAFEVHYQIGDQTMFKLYPMSIDDQEVLIRDYCESIWNLALSIDTGDDSQSESSREYERIIRNMIGFKSPQELTDRLKKDYSEEMFPLFLEKALTTANLTARTRTSLIYDGSVPTKKWIKKTFDDINNGRISDIPISDRVDVFLNPKDISVDFPDDILEVIDTRGFDGNARMDLQKYLKADDVIFIILDRVGEVPGANQKKILTDWINSANKDEIIPRVSIFVKVRDDELEKVNEADGNSERGEEIKCYEISRAIQTEHLNYRVENTLFLDSHYGIFTEKRRPNKSEAKKPQVYISDYDEEYRDENRQKVTDHIHAMIDRFHQTLRQEAMDIEERTEKLIAQISAPSLNKRYSDFLKSITRSVEVLRDGLVGSEGNDGDIQKAFKNFNVNFGESFRRGSKIHWSSAKKTAFMTGTWYKAHLYNELANFTRRVCIGVLESEKNRIIHYLYDFRGEYFEELRPFIDSCQSKVNEDYKNLIERIETNSYHLMVDAFTVQNAGLTYEDWSVRAFQDKPCWERIQRTSGGRGYYDRLMEAFKERMYRRSVDEDIMDMVINEVNNFFGDILDVLNKKINAL